MNKEYYYEKLSALKLNRSSGRPSPHKVCLLLAISDLIQEGSNNKFPLNDDLKRRFNEYFEKFKQGKDSGDISKPFFHLGSEGFWHFELTDSESYSKLVEKKRTPSQKQIRDIIEFASLDSELYQLLQNENDRSILRERIMENLDDLSESFERWLIQLGKSESTAHKYSSAVSGSISNWAASGQICEQNLISIQSFSRINQVAESLGKYQAFIERNKKGNNMYSCAINAYKDFLADLGQVQVTQDIETIIEDKNLSETEKTQLVSTRIGQGQFRQKLFKHWGGCAVTGYKSPQFLVASHIKPWRDSDNQERLSTYNGLLLLPNIDKAFDLGFITFQDTGRIALSEFIESPDALGINAKMKVNLEKQHQDYIAYHREMVFKQ